MQIQAKYKFGLVLIGLALLNDNNHETKSNGGEEKEEENIFEIISKTTKAISPVVIPMIDSLGALETQDVASLSEEMN